MRRLNLLNKNLKSFFSESSLNLFRNRFQNQGKAIDSLFFQNLYTNSKYVNFNHPSYLDEFSTNLQSPLPLFYKYFRIEKNAFFILDEFHQTSSKCFSSCTILLEHSKSLEKENETDVNENEYKSSILNETEDEFEKEGRGGVNEYTDEKNENEYESESESESESDCERRNGSDDEIDDGSDDESDDGSDDEENCASDYESEKENERENESGDEIDNESSDECERDDKQALTLEDDIQNDNESNLNLLENVTITQNDITQNDQTTQRRITELISIDDVKTIVEKVRGKDAIFLDVRDRCEWTDWIVLASGNSTRHLRGMADAIIHHIKMKHGSLPHDSYPVVEGRGCDNWMLVDCGDIVVNFFSEEAREFYNLEELWKVNKNK